MSIALYKFIPTMVFVLVHPVKKTFWIHPCVQLKIWEKMKKL